MTKSCSVKLGLNKAAKDYIECSQKGLIKFLQNQALYFQLEKRGDLAQRQKQFFHSHFS